LKLFVTIYERQLDHQRQWRISKRKLNMASSTASTKLAPLPPFRPSIVKQKLPFEQFGSIQRLLSAQIQLFLQNSPSPSTVLAFLQAYLSDAAHECLESLSSTTPVVGSASPNTTLLRQRVLALLGHLAENHPKSITQAILIDTIIVYGSKNAIHVKRFLSDLLDRRELQFKTAIAASLSRMLSEISSSTRCTIEGVRRAAHILATVVRTEVPAILDGLIDGNTTISDMTTIYDRILPPFLLDARLDDIPLSSGARSWLQTKVDLLDSFHILTGHLLASDRHLESGVTLLFDLTSSVEDVKEKEKSPFVHFPLIADYQHQFDLAQRLTLLNATHDDPRLDVLIVTIANLAPADPSDLGPLSLLLDNSVTNGPLSYGATSGRKGKGKAARVDDGVEEAVTQVLSILPEQDPDFLRACLAHPTFTGSDRTEKLMSALLEGNIPAELMMEEPGVSSVNEPSLLLPSTKDGTGQEQEYKYTKGRQNVFDDQPFDISALRIGKKR
jgi:activating signal cointegrator complex subunit 2